MSLSWVLLALRFKTSFAIKYLFVKKTQRNKRLEILTKLNKAILYFDRKKVVQITGCF